MIRKTERDGGMTSHEGGWNLPNIRDWNKISTCSSYIARSFRSFSHNVQIPQLKDLLQQYTINWKEYIGKIGSCSFPDMLFKREPKSNIVVEHPTDDRSILFCSAFNRSQ